MRLNGVTCFEQLGDDLAVLQCLFAPDEERRSHRGLATKDSEYLPRPRRVWTVIEGERDLSHGMSDALVTLTRDKPLGRRK